MLEEVAPKIINLAKGLSVTPLYCHIHRPRNGSENRPTLGLSVTPLCCHIHPNLLLELVRKDVLSLFSLLP